MLRIWDPTIRPAFLGVSPAAALSWTDTRFRAYAQIRTRSDLRGGDPERAESVEWLLAQADAHAMYDISERIGVGLTTGMRRYQLQTEQQGLWALPTVRGQLAERVRLDVLAGGATRRIKRDDARGTAQFSDWRATLVGQAAIHWWAQDNLRITAGAYRSQNTSAEASEQSNGAGARIAATWWPHPAWSITANVAGEQSRYVLTENRTAPTSQQTTTTQKTRRGRSGVEAMWQPTRSIDVFTHAHATYAGQDAGATTFHVGAGLRMRTSAVLAQRFASSSTRQQLWHIEGAAIRVSIPAPDAASLYLTGDFNEWALPGIPLMPTRDGHHEAVLYLTPGRYAFRVHAVEHHFDPVEDTPQWVELPDYAETEDDSFGGTNGIITIDS
ncbi:MAG: glycogen-binding domain-containing protein [Longimonas sp.]|uniref:glycogen-binding domain-containing protein n=1 Tax=Longimonas sp. TaxID=2039626 RepID=UPI00334CE3FA